MYSPAELEGTSARENEAEGSGFGRAAEGTGFFLSSTCFHVYFSFTISPFLFLVFICLVTVLEETSQLSFFFLTFYVFLYSFLFYFLDWAMFYPPSFSYSPPLLVFLLFVVLSSRLFIPRAFLLFLVFTTHCLPIARRFSIVYTPKAF